MRKTKIVCTLGPATDSPEVLRDIIKTGMDAARMNFSHGTHEEQLARLTQFRAVCGELGVSLPVILDTKGPEVRLGIFPDGPVELTEGAEYILTSRTVDCDGKIASVSFAGLPAAVEPGSSILIDDGLVNLVVERVDGEDIFCRVMNPGVISNRKSINVPGAELGLPAMTDSDRADILFGIENKFDFIAASFVRAREDVLAIQRFIDDNGGAGMKVISKIENRQGVENLSDIISISDGVMIARGDLGVEIPMEEIPVVQKQMIKFCYTSGKPVITATQMLDSMIRNPRPTRAEVTDVANAIYDGTSAIMLSGETASGRYPVEAVRTMVSIAETTEKSIHYWKRFKSMDMGESSSITKAISHATCTTAMDLGVSAIVAVTTSGRTARHISSFRPDTPIIAATTSERVLRQLHLSWGVYPVLASSVASTDEMFSIAASVALQSGIVRSGDLIVVTAGVPVATSGTTNMLKVQLVGNILCSGRGLSGGRATGPICVMTRDTGGKNEFELGNVLVLDDITEKALPLLRLSSAVVLSGEDKDGTAQTLATAFEIPFIVEASGATSILKSGAVVEVDAENGTVKLA